MIRIGSIVLRVDDLQRQTEFWEAALGYVRRDSGESDDFVLLARPTAPGRICAKNMERLWSLAGATGRNRWQMRRPRKRQKQAKTVAVGCHRLRPNLDGKEGVDGSSPSEGFAKAPQGGAVP